jgi:chromate transporter
MVSFLDLFLVFLKIGVFMFGGGYGALSILHKEVVECRGWLSEKEFVDIVGIAESTPGPIAINCATYIGYKLLGVVGSVIATIAVVVPAFITILMVAMLIRPYLETEPARIILRGINSAIVGLIFVALVIISRNVIFKEYSIQIIPLTICLLVIVLVMLFKIHPIEAILISIGLSLALHYIFKLSSLTTLSPLNLR